MRIARAWAQRQVPDDCCSMAARGREGKGDAAVWFSDRSA